MRALQNQSKILDHVLLAGFTHPQILKLCENLTNFLPPDLSKFFFADNGSSAIEIALKMAHHAKNHIGENRPIFLAFTGGYHGETLGALGVSDVGLYKKPYEKLILKQIFAPMPDENLSENLALQKLRQILKIHGKKICAMVLEPLLQCAGGMKIHGPSFVQQACEMARTHGIYVIFDEIATGFGRTGSMFALDQTGIVPDFLALSKGLTGGVLPMSCVATREEIYELFYAPEHTRAFLHSHSYTGNALAAACANATLEIFKNSDVIAQNHKKSAYIWRKFQDLPQKIIKNRRFLGMVFAFDLLDNSRDTAQHLYRLCLARGLLLRPLGSTFYFMPPYVIKRREINFAIKVMCEALQILESSKFSEKI